MTILNDTQVRARKRHRCTASIHILDCYGNDDLKDMLPADDYKTWKAHYDRGRVIEKGESYRRYSVVDQGEFYQNKESAIGYKICCDLDLWNND